jgi:hypothetical protein
MARPSHRQCRELLDGRAKGLDDDSLAAVDGQLQELSGIVIDLFLLRSSVGPPQEVAGESERLQAQAEALSEALNLPLAEALRLVSVNQELNGGVS